MKRAIALAMLVGAMSGCIGGAQPEPPLSGTDTDNTHTDAGAPSFDAGVTGVVGLDAGVNHVDGGTDAGPSPDDAAVDASGMNADDASTDRDH